MEQKIKKCWQQTTFSNNNSLPLSFFKRQSALTSLANRYKRFSRVALFLAITFPLYLNSHLLLRLTAGTSSSLYTATIILGTVFLLIASVMDHWLYKGVSSIDLSRLTVAQSCRQALYYRKKHLQFILILIPIDAIFIGLLAYSLSNNSAALWGMLAGGIIGLSIGSYELYRFMAEYRDITHP